MLRAIEEKGGVGVYTRNLTRELLDIDRENEYVLFYSSAAASGQFADRPNVRERVLRGSGKFIWDQMAVPWACLREGIDVLLHPKFTVPFLAPCPAVMVVHGADWFIPRPALCTDNAAMIAKAAEFKLAAGLTSELSLTAIPNLAS